MKPRCDLSALRRAKVTELASRFAFGGAVSAGAAAIGAHWGPGIGGLFLAFPAILPASLVLVKDKDGRSAACDAAKGAQLGAVGLVAFALTMTVNYRLAPWLSLTISAITWLATSLALWWARFGRSSAAR